ncbi:MAG: 2-methylcitrate dehydratase PrpD [Gammaproteobacteria bacterium]|jgi:2-methylcitrate dehydratase PrpD
MSITAELIQLIRKKPISESDLDAAALFTLDALASAYAGTSTPVGHVLHNWAKSSDLDRNRKAMLMGALTHITETDDLHRASVTHPGCIVVPAALSLGQALGKNGPQILTAILQGFEAMCRIGAGVGPAHYKIWHNTATCGPFGSAMAAACLLNLDDEQTQNALGNAGTQSSGFWQFMETGAMSKHLHAGHAAESGLLAAELALHGFTGSPQILEGEKGFFAGMCDDPTPEKILDDPDSNWQLRQTSIKPWPSCRHTHPAIDCALELHQKLAGRDVQSIKIDTYQAAIDVCDRPEPDSEYQAKFSLYHCTSIALMDGQVGLDSFDSIARQRTASLRKLTSAQVAEPFASQYPKAWGSAVSVTDKDGNQLRSERRDCLGDPELALDNEQMRLKATGLLKYSGLTYSESQSICESVLSLPKSSKPVKIFTDFIRRFA